MRITQMKNGWQILRSSPFRRVNCISRRSSTALMAWLWTGQLTAVPMPLWSTPCWIRRLRLCQRGNIPSFIRIAAAITDGPDGLNAWSVRALSGLCPKRDVHLTIQRVKASLGVWKMKCFMGAHGLVFLWIVSFKPSTIISTGITINVSNCPWVV